MTQKRRLAFLIFPLASLLLGTAVAAQQQPTFRARVDLVSVDVLAVNRGEPLGGLTAADFEIRDNGVPQKVDSISGEGIALQRVPLDVILVFDTSESMAGQELKDLADAGKAVLERLRPGDRAALVTFSQRTRVNHALSADIPSITRALDRLGAAGRTSMFDAFYTGLMMRRATDTRAMLLLFSDGRDNSSWLSAADLAAVARQSDVVVYAVGLGGKVGKDVEEIAQQTGGDTVVATSAKDLKPLFSRMVREMQARYVLNYYPANVERAGWHTIEVRVPGKRADIVARKGYFVAR